MFHSLDLKKIVQDGMKKRWNRFHSILLDVFIPTPSPLKKNLSLFLFLKFELMELNEMKLNELYFNYLYVKCNIFIFLKKIA